LPGPPGDWWGNTGYEQAKREQPARDGRATGEDEDVIATFLHDVPPDLTAEALKRGRDQSSTPMEKPWPLEAWPDVPTKFLLCRDDRLFPAEFMRRVVRDRLGLTPDEITGATPLPPARELADRLDAYRSER
jgi:hypothetical protein